MLRIWVRMRNASQPDDGATLVEYALLLVLIAVVAIVIITQVGENASDALSKANEGLE